jgi:hypothetical protein
VKIAPIAIFWICSAFARFAPLVVTRMSEVSTSCAQECDCALFRQFIKGRKTNLAGILRQVNLNLGIVRICGGRFLSMGLV